MNNALHLSLLILAVVVLVALYWIGRRRADADRPKAPPNTGRRKTTPSAPPASPASPASDQMDLWKVDGKGFDEFGVGQPRKRGVPRVDPVLTGDGRPSNLAPAGAPRLTAPAAPGSDAAPAVDEKIVAFYIAEREGTYIEGPQLHRALRAAGLEYGPKMKIYERLAAAKAGGDQKTVFGVASLLKPGHLDPAAAEGFSTPGLSMFMVLPGPMPAQAAFEDFLATGTQLAEALNAQLYDTSREPLDEGRATALRAEVADWAARNE